MMIMIDEHTSRIATRRRRLGKEQKRYGTGAGGWGHVLCIAGYPPYLIDSFFNNIAAVMQVELVPWRTAGL